MVDGKKVKEGKRKLSGVFSVKIYVADSITKILNLKKIIRPIYFKQEERGKNLK